MKTGEYNNGRNMCMNGNDNLDYHNINQVRRQDKIYEKSTVKYLNDEKI